MGCLQWGLGHACPLQPLLLNCWAPSEAPSTGLVGLDTAARKRDSRLGNLGLVASPEAEVDEGKDTSSRTPQLWVQIPAPPLNSSVSL